MTAAVPSRARRDEVIDALRRGTVPARGLDLLAVGLDPIGPTIDEEIARASSGSTWAGGSFSSRARRSSASAASGSPISSSNWPSNRPALVTPY